MSKTGATNRKWHQLPSSRHGVPFGTRLFLRTIGLFRRLFRLPASFLGDKSRQDAVPFFYPPPRTWDSVVQGILSVPGFPRRLPCQVLMGPDAFVPYAEDSQRLSDGLSVVEDHLACVPLEGSEEPLDPPVLPGAVLLCPLVSDSHPPQPEAEQPRCEDGFVVGSQGPRLPEMLDGLDQPSQQGEGCLGFDGVQSDDPPGSVVDDSEHGMGFPVAVRQPRDVHGPHVVRLDHARLPPLPSPAFALDLPCGFAQHVRDEGLPDAHASLLEDSVEDQRDMPASFFRHARLDPHELSAYPRRLRLEAGGLSVPSFAGAAESVRASVSAAEPPTQEEDSASDDDGNCQNGDLRRGKVHDAKVGTGAFAFRGALRGFTPAEGVGVALAMCRFAVAKAEPRGRLPPLDWSTSDTSQPHTTFLSYNLFDKLQWKRDADGREEFHDYDGTGRLIATHVYPDPSLPSGVSLAWENLYDWNDSARILTETDPLGTKTLFHWDGLGRDTLIERDSGRYESVGSGTASAGAHASSTSSRIQVHQVYDNLGNLVRLTDPKGLVETRRYDDRNRLVETVYPDDLRHAVGYDLASRTVADTQSSSQGLVTKKLWYDGLDRLVSEDYGSGARENASYIWDGSVSDKGRLSQVVRGTGVTASYGYDAVGRRTSRAVTYQNLSLGQGWSYDLAGSPVQWTLPGGAHGSAGYDVFHRLSGSALVRGTDSVSVLGSVAYRRNDLLSSYGLGKRLSVREGYESQRSVLTDHQVVRLLSRGPSVQDTLYRERLGWDGAGNVIGMLRGNGDSLLFGLDHLYQLREVDYPDGQRLITDYDANGNRVRHRHPMGDSTSDSFVYSGNRVTAGQTARKGVTTYRHDIQGNLSVESDYSTVSDTGDASKAWRVTERRFNRRNELERVMLIRRMGTTDTTLLGFVYGEDGNRIASLQGSVIGNDTTWTATHRWVYDGSVISADSGDGHGWRWHAYQGLSRIAEGEDTGNLRVRYVVTDHQGTTQLLTDDTGAVLGRWTWDPWGNIEEAWSQSSTDLLYQGKPYEVALGEWYFNARWYNPERGNFTGRDPKLQFWTPYTFMAGGDLVGSIDMCGGVQMSIEFKHDFPKTYSRLYSMDHRLTDAKYDAYSEITGASMRDVNYVFKFGSGPEVVAATMDGNENDKFRGEFNGYENPNLIKINVDLVTNQIVLNCGDI